jgi:3-dehydroquinate dehydratase-2
MNILILNGPNLNMIGIREPEIYGNKTYQDLEDYCNSFEKQYNVTIDIKQTNYEGIIIDLLQWSHDHFDGVLLNAGAFTHYSYAIRDTIKAINTPVVEVHLSDIKNREDFRKLSVIEDVVLGSVMGKGFKSYEEGLRLLLEEGVKK